MCRTPAGSACVDEPVQFGDLTSLSLDFALCSQKSTKELFKSTHVKRLQIQVVTRVSMRPLLVQACIP